MPQHSAERNVALGTFRVQPSRVHKHVSLSTARLLGGAVTNEALCATLSQGLRITRFLGYLFSAFIIPRPFGFEDIETEQKRQ